MPEKYPIHLEIKKKHPRVSSGWIKKISSKILRALGWKQAGLSLLLVSDAEIRKFNKRHLKHDWATDVISFSQLEDRKLKRVRHEIPMLGDIIISIDTTVRQAKEYGNDFLYELAFYLCHGILHLMGHDDATRAQAERMWAKQTAILKKIKVQRMGYRVMQKKKSTTRCTPSAVRCTN